MKVLGGSSGSFRRAARRRGLRSKVARILAPAARELSPNAPEDVLDSRELFEKAAMRAVIGEAGNLELSFRLVDALASALERLGLARESDVPDPFRRVWVESDSGMRNRGVVLRCQAGEVAVFCPPRGKSSEDIGSVLHVHYRGFSSQVGYDLRLNDAVRLPGALVLHLTRLEGSGAIGRSAYRYPVSLAALACGGDGKQEACEVLDISSGGLHMQGTQAYDMGEIVHIEVQLGDADERPFTAQGDVRWIVESEGRHNHGLMFRDLPAPHVDRLMRFLRSLPGPDRGE